MISKKHNKVFTALNYIEHLVILASVVIGYVSISDFASLVDIFMGLARSTKGLKICATTKGDKSITQ